MDRTSCFGSKHGVTPLLIRTFSRTTQLFTFQGVPSTDSVDVRVDR
ncbi:MAG: hypothetical protein ACREJO_01190 [Phycisphaerales bacterium]